MSDPVYAFGSGAAPNSGVGKVVLGPTTSTIRYIAVAPNANKAVTCGACAFWHMTDTYGFCRRRPPDLTEAWPITHQNDWCGEGEPRP